MNIAETQGQSMSLPEFTISGDLPPGVHRASWGELLERFGAGGDQRKACTWRLAHIYELARRTDSLQRFVVFGSYVTAKAEPGDVDVILVMDDSFRLEKCPLELRGLFDHAIAQARYGASVFWIRPALLIGESIEEFISYWQVKRGGAKRGIVEVTS
ncbi:MAG: hypothetical protein IH623_07070 [Verrucomicrobia bacterium]|nr:hypothetical protein [Verrucomicrobiota bacterium]